MEQQARLREERYSSQEFEFFQETEDPTFRLNSLKKVIQYAIFSDKQLPSEEKTTAQVNVIKWIMHFIL